MARLLAHVTGMVNQQLLLQNEYPLAENRILRAHLPSCLLLTDLERSTLAVIGKRLGRRRLETVAAAAKHDTILAWFRKLVAQKFDGSQHRLYPRRPTIGREITELIVRLARENGGWVTIASPEHLRISAIAFPNQTVGNILRRFVFLLLQSVGSRLSWSDFIRFHMAVLPGIDFFIEVLTWRGLATHYVVFFLHLETRRVMWLESPTSDGGMDWCGWLAELWMTSTAPLLPVRFVLHDRDSKFCASFRDTLRSAGVQLLSLPARSPNLNAFAERWVSSIKGECLSKLILLGEASLHRAVTQFIEHYHLERPHQGKGNQLLFPSPVSPPSRHAGRIQCHERLGGCSSSINAPDEYFDPTAT